jgi:arsenate reductase
MTDLTLYHNPRCSKSRGALELLEARGLAPTVVRYLETPLDAAQLTGLLKKLGITDQGDTSVPAAVAPPSAPAAPSR